MTKHTIVGHKGEVFGSCGPTLIDSSIPHEPVKYSANFLFPHVQGSIEEAGYEFANAKTEEYQKEWWETLKIRIKRDQP
jgi:hypothetical protein